MRQEFTINSCEVISIWNIEKQLCYVNLDLTELDIFTQGSEGAAWLANTVPDNARTTKGPRVCVAVVRASPRVWQILLGKSSVLPTPKTIWQVKKDPLSKSLLFLTCQNQKIRPTSIFLIGPNIGSETMPSSDSLANLRPGGGILPTWEICQVRMPICWRRPFLVLPKIYCCQLDLPNSWRCSNNIL